jgi:hypothetical protein
VVEGLGEMALVFLGLAEGEMQVAGVFGVEVGLGKPRLDRRARLLVKPIGLQIGQGPPGGAAGGIEVEAAAISGDGRLDAP